MTLRNLTFGFLVFAGAILSAASQYKIELLRPTMVGSTQLKPGNYTLEVDGGKAMIKNGKNVVAETTVTAE
ncbi:MAG: hypothetical protein ABI995_13785, partial [Acidobacteriota bacterium]